MFKFKKTRLPRRSSKGQENYTGAIKVMITSIPTPFMKKKNFSFVITGVLWLGTWFRIYVTTEKSQSKL